MTSGDYSILVGGRNNSTSGVCSSILGGSGNTATGDFSTIGGGQENIVSGQYSIIGGGRLNSSSGDYSSILGGMRAKIKSGDNGSTVLADGQDRDHFSKGEQTCSLDFASGVYLRLPSFTGTKNQNGNLGELKVSGDYLYIATGTNTWGRVQISSF